MTDHQKLQFFKLLAEENLKVQQYDPEECSEEWEIQEIGEIPWGDGWIGVRANWWGKTFLEAVTNWSLDNKL